VISSRRQLRRAAIIGCCKRRKASSASGVRDLSPAPFVIVRLLARCRSDGTGQAQGRGSTKRPEAQKTLAPIGDEGAGRPDESPGKAKRALRGASRMFRVFCTRNSRRTCAPGQNSNKADDYLAEGLNYTTRRSRRGRWLTLPSRLAKRWRGKAAAFMWRVPGFARIVASAQTLRIVKGDGWRDRGVRP